MAGVKSVQGAGLGSGLGEVAGETSLEGVEGETLMRAAGLRLWFDETVQV